MNKKREAYMTLLTAAQKQIPQEVNLVVEEHFIPNCPFPQQIPKGWACPVCGREVDDGAHYCKYCGQNHTHISQRFWRKIINCSFLFFFCHISKADIFILTISLYSEINAAKFTFFHCSLHSLICEQCYSK